MIKNSNKDNFINVINNLVKLDKISHSYIIETESFDENNEKILLFIKLILCNEKDKSFSKLNCNKCNICKLVDDNNYPDLKIINPDGNWIKKEQLIKLKDDFQNCSLLDNKRIYIINNAEKMNQSSGNAFLKFLEEPEDNIIAILITNNRYKILDTILSRCQIISLNDKKNNNDVDENILKMISYMIDENDLFLNYSNIFNEILSDKIIAKSKLIELESIFVNHINNLCNVNKINNVLKNISRERIVKYVLILESEIQKLEYNVNYKLWLDNLFSKFVEVNRNV